MSRASVFTGVDVHAKRNHDEHHTSELPEDQLTVRRGQAFKVTLDLAKPFKQGIDSLVLIASTGGKRSLARSLACPTCRSISDVCMNFWGKKVLPVLVTPPADAPIGRYALKATLWGEDKTVATLVLLYNPWFSGDSVFLADEQERREYVGPPYDMVDICLNILDKSLNYRKNPAGDLASRGDPVYVGRVISAMINSPDDRGVVMGNWSDSFEGGLSPSHWSGSHDILSMWKNNNFRTVKYGQCWVFAGVMCSVMRLLGIPTRVVSNFVSAHDTDASLTIDVYHADEGARRKESNDSIWNYHVWVESWMKRPDLKANGKYDGWQVLDATPQEASDGLYQCGPSSLVAIFNGETQLPYDVPFVFAEVNADCVDWLTKADGTDVKMSSDTKRVGKSVSTKAVGYNKRLDITRTYKHREGEYPGRVRQPRARLTRKSAAVFQARKRSGPCSGTPSAMTKTACPTIQLGACKIVQPTNVRKNTTGKKKCCECFQLSFGDPLEMVMKELDLLVWQVNGFVRQHQVAYGEVIFMNPLQETLTGMTLTVSGSGLLRQEPQPRPRSPFKDKDPCLKVE
uniref:Transglutaminase-like domain-containing protein n=1 Tax=Hippocampus comes TaxID=109280 RepID=A0A3Q3DE98_HIPCM